MMKAWEMDGRVDEKRRLSLDGPVPCSPGGVRVIILLEEETDGEEEATQGQRVGDPAFEFLTDPEEDIYTLKDGARYHDEG